jgi:hypothetical protein
VRGTIDDLGDANTAWKRLRTSTPQVCLAALSELVHVRSCLLEMLEMLILLEMCKRAMHHSTVLMNTGSIHSVMNSTRADWVR